MDGFFELVGVVVLGAGGWGCRDGGVGGVGRVE